MPAPIGPRPIRTSTSPALIGSAPCPLIAAIASLSRVKTRAGPSLAVDAVGVDDGRVDRRALDDRAFGREVAARERDGAGQAALAGTARAHDDVVGVDAVLLEEAVAKPRAPAARFATSRARAPSGSPVAVSADLVEQAEGPEVEHDLGHAAGEEGADRRVIVGAVGQDADQARDPDVDRVPVVDRGPRQTRRRRRWPGCAAAGSSSRRTRRGRSSRC